MSDCNFFMGSYLENLEILRKTNVFRTDVAGLGKY